MKRRLKRHSQLIIFLLMRVMVDFGTNIELSMSIISEINIVSCQPVPCKIIKNVQLIILPTMFLAVNIETIWL